MIELVLYIPVFLAGLFIGSFLNVVADRSVLGGSIFIGRSKCDFCKKPLKAKDLFPVFSYLSTRGKCRYCKEDLSHYYPISEFLTGSVYVLVAYQLGIFTEAQHPSLWVIFAYLIIVLSFFIILFLTDIKYRLLPNKIVYPAIIIVLLFLAFSTVFSVASSYHQLQNDTFGKYLIEAGFWWQQTERVIQTTVATLVSSLIIGLFFWGLTLIKDGKAMGGGDVKLAFLIGLFIGFPENVLAIFLGFLTGAVFSVALIAISKKGVKDTIAFGPFLILGCFIALFWGQQLIDWYLNLF